MKYKRGSITVYLSLVMVAVILLVSVVAERARVSVVQSKCKANIDMATESVMAGYGKQILDDYGLLLAWENVPVEEQINEYLQANINLAEVKGQGSNLMNTNIVQIEKCDVGYVTEENGKLFIEQVNAYVKYAGLTKLAQRLIEKYTTYSEGSEEEVTKESEKSSTDIVDKENEELQNTVEEIEELITELKEVEKDYEQYELMVTNKDDLKSFKKDFKKLVNLLKNKEVQKTIDLIKEYESEKSDYLKENGYKDNIVDYMSENLNSLEIIEDKIEELKELDVSSLLENDANTEKLINSTIDKAKDVLEKLRSLQVAKKSKEDEKNKSLYENAKDLINEGIVALVVDDATNISQNAISVEDLPSQYESENTESENLENKVNLLVYSNLYFGNFLTPKEDTALQYEMEYLLNGESCDRDNFASTIEKLVLMRNGINILTLLSDSTRMAEIKAIATSVATLICLPFMEIVIEGILVEAWALAESIYEVKALLKGWKVPLIKTPKKWNTEIYSLLKTPTEDENISGLDYLTYCNILMIFNSTETIAYRIMDLIQANIQSRYNTEFLMKDCFTKIDIKVQFETQPLFMAMPWTLSLRNEQGGYSFAIKGKNSY